MLRRFGLWLRFEFSPRHLTSSCITSLPLLQFPAVALITALMMMIIKLSCSSSSCITIMFLSNSSKSTFGVLPKALSLDKPDSFQLKLPLPL